MCQQYKISRHTAREALRFLEQAGLVIRKQGSGTKVINDQIPQTINQYINSVEDLMTFAKRTRFDILSAQKLPLTQSTSTKLNVQQAQQYIEITGVRIEPKSQQTQCFSRLSLFVKDAQLSHDWQDKNLVFKYIVEVLKPERIGKIEQKISATMINETLASQLHCAPHSAGLVIERRYCGKNNSHTILVAKSIYPEDRFIHSSILYGEK